MGCTISISFDPDTTTVRALYTILSAFDDMGWYQEDLIWDDTGIIIPIGEGEAEEIRAYFRANKALRDLDLKFTVEDW